MSNGAANMMRRDDNATDEDLVPQAKNDVSDLWRINPWLTSHMIGAAHGQGIDAAAQQRGLAVFTALSERSAAETAAASPEPKHETSSVGKPR
jgi:hypothetical protein